MKIILRIFTLVCMWAATTSLSSAQTPLLSGVYHETGVTFDGTWHNTGIVGNAMTITVYEGSMYYGNDYAVRRGNANVYGFSGKCRWCYGSGWWEAKRDGVLCPNCDKNHNGVCNKCHGTGKVYGNLNIP